MLEICKPKAGEILVVTGAAGAVGSQVGQIAKILGMKVIGIAGSNEKCKWLIDNLGFDHAFNYKIENIATALKKAALDGINCFFDNVIEQQILIYFYKFIYKKQKFFKSFSQNS